MTKVKGSQVTDYQAPVFLAWQITNRCTCQCLACCEESGPNQGWPDELTAAQTKQIARQIVEMGIPYVAFGGGEPLEVPHIWEVLDILAAAGTNIKIETNGHIIDKKIIARLKTLNNPCVQISLDGATAEIHERLRPGSDFQKVVSTLKKLSSEGIQPEVVFSPTKLNLREAPAVFELAVKAGARAFVTGPLMRLGRAAQNWRKLAPSSAEWTHCVSALKKAQQAARSDITLSIYPWGIVEELQARLKSPQAMMLVVPNGQVKILNALPFVCADLRQNSLEQAWESYKEVWASSQVCDFISQVGKKPGLLNQANECWL